MKSGQNFSRSGQKSFIHWIDLLPGLPLFRISSPVSLDLLSLNLIYIICSGRRALGYCLHSKSCLQVRHWQLQLVDTRHSCLRPWPRQNVECRTSRGQGAQPFKSHGHQHLTRDFPANRGYRAMPAALQIQHLFHPHTQREFIRWAAQGTSPGFRPTKSGRSKIDQ